MSGPNCAVCLATAMADEANGEVQTAIFFEKNNGSDLFVKIFKESSLVEESMDCYRIDIFKVGICTLSDNVFRATKPTKETYTKVRSLIKYANLFEIFLPTGLGVEFDVV